MDLPQPDGPMSTTSDSSKESHEACVLTPTFPRFGVAFHLTVSKCGGLHLQIRFGVDIRCVERDMTEPGADRVNVNAGAKQVAGAGMANGMRADAFLLLILASWRRPSWHNASPSCECQNA